MFILQFLDELEKESDRLVVALYSQTHVVAVLFDDLDVDEFMSQALDHAKECTLYED